MGLVATTDGVDMHIHKSTWAGQSRPMWESFALIICLVLGTVSSWAQSPSEPQNVSQLKAQLKDYYAVEYPRAVATVLKDATEWVHERASKVKRPAIVLDIDETSLSNWDEIVANDFAYVANQDVGCVYPPKMPCDGVSWERLAKAKAITPTLALFQEALKLNVAVFFITGRLDDAEGKERVATESNLKNTGYQGFAKVFLRPDRNGTVEAYKSGKRAEIESDGFTIIANVGDQYSDLRGGHSEKAFKVPNPFYFIP